MKTSEGQLRLRQNYSGNPETGHVQKGHSGYIWHRILNMEQSGRRKRGPQRRFMAVVKKDMQRFGVTEEDNRIEWDGGRWSTPVTQKGSSQQKITWFCKKTNFFKLIILLFMIWCKDIWAAALEVHFLSHPLRCPRRQDRVRVTFQIKTNRE